MIGAMLEEAVRSIHKPLVAIGVIDFLQSLPNRAYFIHNRLLLILSTSKFSRIFTDS